jgi:hypothetical protein
VVSGVVMAALSRRVQVCSKVFFGTKNAPQRMNWGACGECVSPDTLKGIHGGYSNR